VKEIEREIDKERERIEREIEKWVERDICDIDTLSVALSLLNYSFYLDQDLDIERQSKIESEREKVTGRECIRHCKRCFR
jgi:ABC-type phosphate transport system auxiliary subunit